VISSYHFSYQKLSVLIICAHGSKVDIASMQASRNTGLEMSTLTVLDVADAGRLLLLGPRRIRAMVRSGELPHIALPDGEVRFIEADLLAWIESRKRGGQEERLP
jgi:hypothetical protein